MHHWKSNMNIFNSQKSNTTKEKDLNSVIDEVYGVKKVSYNLRSKILDSLPIKTTHSLRRKTEIDRKCSIFWKLSDALTESGNSLTHDSSPLKELLSSCSEHMKALSKIHTEFEEEIIKTLGPDQTLNKFCTKDYQLLQQDKENLKKKKKELEHAKTKCEREHKTSKGQMDRSYPRINEDVDRIMTETCALEDKLETTVYSLQSREWELTNNLLNTYKELQKFFQKGHEYLEEVVPKIEEKLRESPKQPVFGTDLIRHLRISNETIAKPLTIGYKGLKKNLKEEGIFRIGPSLCHLNKIRAEIDANKQTSSILKSFKDPFLYASLIKAYLRDLPNSLFCNEYVDEWREVNKIEEDYSKMRAIQGILKKLPKGHADNIAFLFKLLSAVAEEEFSNKMSVDNIIIVVGPNLLRDSSGMSVLINSVFTLMIQNYDWIFMQDNNLNPLTASNIPWLTSIFNESVTSLNSMNNDEDADFDDQYEKTIERIGNILEVDEKEVFDLDNVRVNEEVFGVKQRSPSFRRMFGNHQKNRRFKISPSMEERRRTIQETDQGSINRKYKVGKERDFRRSKSIEEKDVEIYEQSLYGRFNANRESSNQLQVPSNSRRINKLSKSFTFDTRFIDPHDHDDQGDSDEDDFFTNKADNGKIMTTSFTKY